MCFNDNVLLWTNKQQENNPIGTATEEKSSNSNNKSKEEKKRLEFQLIFNAIVDGMFYVDRPRVIDWSEKSFCSRMFSSQDKPLYLRIKSNVYKLVGQDGYNSFYYWRT